MTAPPVTTTEQAPAETPAPSTGVAGGGSGATPSSGPSETVSNGPSASPPPVEKSPHLRLGVGPAVTNNFPAESAI
jgi:hypothetical protein